MAKREDENNLSTIKTLDLAGEEGLEIGAASDGFVIPTGKEMKPLVL